MCTDNIYDRTIVQEFIPPLTVLVPYIPAGLWLHRYGSLRGPTKYAHWRFFNPNYFVPSHPSARPIFSWVDHITDASSHILTYGEKCKFNKALRDNERRYSEESAIVWTLVTQIIPRPWCFPCFANFFGQYSCVSLLIFCFFPCFFHPGTKFILCLVF